MKSINQHINQQLNYQTTGQPAQQKQHPTQHQTRYQTQIATIIADFAVPNPDSHKGQNGKLLLIGGSELFHAASKWSLDTASRFVDMVFYASVPENNQLIEIAKKAEFNAKKEFWNGIVVPREQITEYAQEADVILIGPGMERTTYTQTLVNKTVAAFPHKKWVIDAGALQMIDPNLIPASAIITPHHREITILEQKGFSIETAIAAGITIILKGRIDTLYSNQLPDKSIQISGGNAGLTKGGTGDVLAGLVAGLYATQTPLVAATIASIANKKAADLLYESVGTYFNASDLVNKIPQTIQQLIC